MKDKLKAIFLVVGVFGLIVALNFIFFVDSRENEEDEATAERSSYKATPYGILALYTVLEEAKYPVTRFEQPLTELKPGSDIGTLFVISPQAYPVTQEEIDSLEEWVSAGRLLIVVDREVSIQFSDGTKVNTKIAPSEVPVRPSQPTSYTNGIDRIELSKLAARVRVEGQSTTEHLGDEHGAVLADSEIGSGRVIFLTDPYVVANNGISKADNLVLALNLLQGRPAGRIAFDEYHHGYGSLKDTPLSGSVIDYFRGTPIPWMLAQAGLIAVLLIYSRGRRFGRALPQARDRRTTNLEFVSSMANIVRLARASDLAMQNIYSEFRRKLCAYSRLPSKTATPKLAASVAGRSKMSEVELRQVLMRCERVYQGERIADSDLLDLVSRIRRIESRLEGVQNTTR